MCLYFSRYILNLLEIIFRTQNRIIKSNIFTFVEVVMSKTKVPALGAPGQGGPFRAKSALAS